MNAQGALVFVDATATSPYTLDTLENQALGGTEATVLRVAQGLRQSHSVILAQSAVSQSHSCQGLVHVHYDHKNPLSGIEPKAIIVVRGFKLLPRLRRQFPDTPLFLWLHCFPGRKRKHLGSILNETRTDLVCVSNDHKAKVEAFIQHREPGLEKRPQIHRIYNPIDDHLQPDDTPVDPNRLIFFSSPHKGIEQVFRAFKAVRKEWPEMKLYLANPGYLFRDHPNDLEGIVKLGPLPHKEVIKQVRQAYCLFYPQATFRETFGLVFAEANAVGTPVLAHPIGSAAEVVNPAEKQLIDARDPQQVIETLRNWRHNGSPQVQARPEFRLATVIKDWERLIRRSLARQVKARKQGSASAHRPRPNSASKNETSKPMELR